ncbi:MAG: PQQ-binding-like beta-propeller repeat protein, partial [bacterium]
MIGKVVVGIFAAAGLLSLCLWLSADTPVLVEERIPGTDRKGQPDTNQTDLFPWSEKLTTSAGVPADLKGAWPCFRGSDLDNISKETFEPIAPKGESGFPVCWAIDVGEGFAGAAILNGRVYLLDYDREETADTLRCLSLADGEEIWRYSYRVKVKRNHGMSRTVPSVTEDHVVALGPKCNVTCLDSKSGEKKWSLDLVRDFGATVPDWYAGQCPLIDRNRVILAPGGTALMIAVDCVSGEVVWEAPNPNNWKMTHSSITPMEFNGRRMYVYCASGGVAGVSAEDGQILWEAKDWKIRIANVPSPLIVGEDRIFLCGGYEAGSMMLRLKEQGGRIIPETLFRLDPERFGSVQHTPILYEGHIYGVRPDGQLVCLNLEGNEKWASSSAHKFGGGSYMIIGSLIHVLNDTGLLSRV